MEGSHGCKSMPDSVNVSEIQPSMERHTSVVRVQALTAKKNPSLCFVCGTVLYPSESRLLSTKPQMSCNDETKLFFVTPPTAVLKLLLM